MKTKNIGLNLDIILNILFIFVLISSIIFYPGLIQLLGLSPISIPQNIIKDIHIYSGLIMGIFSLIHLSLHSKLIKNVITKKLSDKKLKQKIYYDILITIFLLISFIAGLILGYIQPKIYNHIINKYQLFLIHYNIGLILILLISFHIVLNYKTIIKTIKKNFKKY